METLSIRQKPVEPRYDTTANRFSGLFGADLAYSDDAGLPTFGQFDEYAGRDQVEIFYNYKWLMDGLFYSALIGDVDSFVMLRTRQIEKTKLVSSTRTTVLTDAAVAKDRLRYYTAALEGHNQIIIDIIEGKFDPSKSIPSPYQVLDPVAVPMFSLI